jgi:hypothetical protein
MLNIYSKFSGDSEYLLQILGFMEEIQKEEQLVADFTEIACYFVILFTMVENRDMGQSFLSQPFHNDLLTCMVWFRQTYSPWAVSL